MCLSSLENNCLNYKALNIFKDSMLVNFTVNSRSLIVNQNVNFVN